VRKLMFLAGAFSLLGMAKPALCAQILGRLYDCQGTPISDVKVAVSDPMGKPIRVVTTDQKGVFSVKGLDPGNYRLMLHPLTGGSLGGVLAFHLSPSGVTVRWMIMPARPAVVLAPNALPGLERMFPKPFYG
jgi:hypothetical protein